MYSETVSIIIPIYNCEKYITRCLNSLINQTYSNIEIILVNDGSNDKSEDIIKESAKNDKIKKYGKNLDKLFLLIFVITIRFIM